MVASIFSNSAASLYPISCFGGFYAIGLRNRIRVIQLYQTFYIIKPIYNNQQSQLSTKQKASNKIHFNVILEHFAKSLKTSL